MRLSLFLLLPFFPFLLMAQPDPDNTEAAMQQLKMQRQKVAQLSALSPVARARVLLQLGEWEKAEQWLQEGSDRSEVLELQAQLAFLRHRYALADSLNRQLLHSEPENRAAQLLQIDLLTQAWQLDEAEKNCHAMLAATAFDEVAMCKLSYIRRLKKDFEGAMAWAEKATETNPNNALTYQAAAEVHFWNRDLIRARALVLQALQRDPLLADARYLYGYAIWRLGDATQLPKMADQWELALEINPMHHYTHWHWGNGHTHLTWKDYAEGEPTEANVALNRADKLFYEGKYAAAYAVADSVAAVYPQSPRPPLAKGGLLYLDPEMPLAHRLDKAEAAFLASLDIKPHFGPAHNGLAAVIEQRKMRWLYCYDSLENALATTTISRPKLLEQVFPDLKNHPERVAKMVESSLFAAKAYLPMLARMGKTFKVPPLHHDIARAMGSLYFRKAATFDNRQWMDIRGVGSGMAGIEYVERGVHLQRNVLLHEFVHLFHIELLTEAQKRRIRALYLQAMKEGRTLDYYAASNEHEYFAQTYTAYFMERKVHPLNHKAANTASELKQKDPACWAFIDSLVQEQKLALQGDSKALASNWAQAYVSLAKEKMRKSDEASLQQAKVFIDSALFLVENYPPALLQLGWWEVRAEKQSTVFSGENPLVQPTAAIYAARAEHYQQLFEDRKLSTKQAFDWQYKNLQKAHEMENDVMEKAQLAQRIVETCYQFARYDLLESEVERLFREIPAVSTYLEDIREAIIAKRWEVGAELRFPALAAELFQLSQENPNNFDLMLQVADAYAGLGDYPTALEILNDGKKRLAAAGYGTAAFSGRIAFYGFLKDGKSAEFKNAWLRDATNRMFAARQLIAQEKTAEARELLKAYKFSPVPQEQAAYRWVLGLLNAAENQPQKAAVCFKEALSIHPWHVPAAESLMTLLKEQGKQKEAKKLLKTLKKQRPRFSKYWLLDWKAKLKE